MPYKDHEKQKACQRKWYYSHLEDAKAYYRANRKRILKQKQVYAIKNREKIQLYRKHIRQKMPWYSSYYNAKNRCTNQRSQNFKTYGQRGIKFLLTLGELELIWNRDRAHRMERPSIDRINNNGHYEFANCRFIEMSTNATKGNYEVRWAT